MRWLLILLGFVVLVLLLGRCGSSGPPGYVGGGTYSGGSAPDSAVLACTARGVKYFGEIGSWPRLSDGRDARAVAADRCSRSTAAFP